MGVHHKVHKYLEYHSVCPLVQIRTPQRGGGGWTHSPAGEGVEESQFVRLEKKPSTLSSMWGTLKRLPAPHNGINQRAEAVLYLIKS